MSTLHCFAQANASMIYHGLWTYMTKCSPDIMSGDVPWLQYGFLQSLLKSVGTCWMEAWTIASKLCHRSEVVTICNWNRSHENPLAWDLSTDVGVEIPSEWNPAYMSSSNMLTWSGSRTKYFSLRSMRTIWSATTTCCWNCWSCWKTRWCKVFLTKRTSRLSSATQVGLLIRSIDFYRVH